MSLHQNNKLFLVHEKRRLVSHWPPASEIGMLLIKFVELRVVAGRSRQGAGRPQAVSTAALCRGFEMNGMVEARHGRGMANAKQTRPHCVNQMGKTHSKPLAARHGMGTAWARRAMCESVFILPLLCIIESLLQLILLVHSICFEQDLNADRLRLLKYDQRARLCYN
jgi:hypothetical protein